MHRYIGRMVDDKTESRIVDIDLDSDDRSIGATQYTAWISTRDGETFLGHSQKSSNDALFDAIESWESHYEDGDYAEPYHPTKPLTEAEKASMEIGRLSRSLQFSENFSGLAILYALFAPFILMLLSFAILGRLNDYTLEQNDYFLVLLIPVLNWFYVVAAPFFFTVSLAMKEALVMFWVLAISSALALVAIARLRIGLKRPKVERRIAELNKQLSSQLQ
jgi:hypothetical protein